MPRRKKTKRRGRPSLLSRLGTAELMRELDRRRGMQSQLEQRRGSLERELEALNAELASLGAAPSGGNAVATRGRKRGAKAGRGGFRRGRGGNAMSLNATLQQVLSGKTMGAAEAAEAVKQTGYKSKSPNFRSIIAIALSTNKKLFKRVSRGQYTAR